MVSFEEKLIAFVRANDFLYNTKSGSYTNVNKRELAWTQIARKLHRPVDECRQRWKSLRDRYVREKKKMEGGSNMSESEMWPLYSKLDFLSDSLVVRRHIGIPEPLLNDSSGSPQQMHSPNPGIHFSFLELPTDSSMASSCSNKPQVDALEFSVSEGTNPYQSQTTPQRPNNAEWQNFSQRSHTTELQENDYFMQMINKKMKSLPYIRQIRLQEKILTLVNREMLLNVESSDLQH